MGVMHYTSGTTPNYLIDFGEDFENDCTYSVGVEVLFSTNSSTSTTREAMILSDGREIPVVRVDDITSSCSKEEDEGEIYLVLEPIEGLREGDEVLDYIWEQVRGQQVTCIDSAIQNCGGNGNAFLYVPKESVQPCEIYSWEATVVIGTSSGAVTNVTLPLCDMSFLPPPTDGTCFVVSENDSDSDCDVHPFSEAIIQCQGWNLGCEEESATLTTQILKQSESNTDSLIPLTTPSLTMQNTFLVSGEDIRIIVQVCNGPVCANTESISIAVCEENEEQRDENIQLVLETTQEDLEEDKLEEALQSLLAVSGSLEECEQYFNEVITLTEEYISANLASVDGNATNLQDTTTLMELLGLIGSRSCSTPITLFESLLLLCNATTTANVQTFALDELLQAITTNANSDDQRIDALDFAIQVNECVQASSLGSRCSNRLATLYGGDSFYYAQYIFTMQQFQEEEVTIDIPNATVIFPVGFDEQIARDYTLSTGDSIIRFSCVAINMVRSDVILSTNVAIDSAIIGMTASVYVNGSAFIIELGHQGEPVIGVILRIYRQTEEDRKRGEGQTIKNPEVSLNWGKKKNEFRNNNSYSKRLSLGGSCDESISCSYYEGEGTLSTNGCQTVDITDEWVDCSCDHYSNFGLLFSSCDGEEWTIWRILTLALLCTIWTILLIFGAVVQGSAEFRIWSGLETMAEKRTRVYGDAQPGFDGKS